MKINIDVDDSLQQDMITIHCREITDEILELQRLLSQNLAHCRKLCRI